LIRRHQFFLLPLPASHVVDFSRERIWSSPLVAVEGADVILLLAALERISHERGIADDEVGTRPVESEGVSFDDAIVWLEREEIDIAVGDAGRFAEHLALGNPKGRLGDFDGKVVDFESVEMRQGNLHEVPGEVENTLTAIHGLQELVL